MTQAAAQGPTPSPESNRLIVLCRKVAQGEAPLRELSDLIEERMAALEQSRQDFLERHQSQGYSEVLETEADMLLLAYATYKEALEFLADLVANNQLQKMETGIEQVADSTEAMVMAMMRYSDKAMIGTPTPSPYINVLLKAVEANRLKLMPDEPFRQMMENARGFLAQGRKEALASGESRADLEAIGKHYTQQEEGITEILAFLDDGDEAHLNRGVAQVVEGAAQLQSLLIAFQEKALMDGPTDIPAANLLINAALQWSGGELNDEQFREILGRYRSFSAQVRAEFQELCRIEVDSVAVQEEIPRLQDALIAHEAAVENLGRAGGSRDPGGVEQAITGLQEALQTLKEAVGRLETLESTSGRHACPHCLHLNPPESRNCSRCGAVMPRYPGVATISTMDVSDLEPGATESIPITENMTRLQQAVDDLKGGAMTPDQFNAMIHEMRTVVNSAMKEAAAIDLNQLRDEPGADLALETVEVLREGLDEFNAGLDILALYTQHSDPASLEQGMARAWAGTTRLIRVQQVGAMLDENPETPEAAGPPGAGTDSFESQG